MVLLSLQLETKGLTAVGIGLVLTLCICTASLGGLASAWAATRFGRRLSLAATGLLMACSGFDIAFASQHWLLALAALTGMLAGTLDVGPYLAVEQAVLAEMTPARQRNRAFSLYSLTGLLAASGGAMVSGQATNPGRIEAFFLLYGVIGLATAVLPLLLSDAVEGQPTGGQTFKNLKPLVGLAALFALDSFGGGWIAQPVLVYWLHIRFGAGAAVLGPVFAAVNLLNALSSGLSGRIADRIGLINTMVVTHFPSNVMLLLVAAAPNLGIALALLLLRATISQMDAPMRQAYVVSIVEPSERAGAIAVTVALRGVTMAAGPVLTGFAIQAATLGLPFLVGGGAKIAYDLALFFGYRNKRARHEAVR
jgi:MFS family permease